MQARLLLEMIRMLEDRRASPELVIKLLERKGLARLLSVLESPDKPLRKASAKLLVILAHRNEKAQTLLCENLGFSPINGIVTINSMPRQVKE